MTIDEARAELLIMQNKIQAHIEDFERKTGLSVEGIELQRLYVLGGYTKVLAVKPVVKFEWLPVKYSDEDEARRQLGV